MKKLYFSLFLAVVSLSINAQTSSCYDEYRKVFENRGADAVEDGTHDNVILSVRSKETTDCYVCKVIIKNNDIVEIAIYYQDDTKEIITYEFKDNVAWTITNGISRTRITKNDEQINLMFTSKIKPKKKEYKKAPLPKFELN